MLESQILGVERERQAELACLTNEEAVLSGCRDASCMLSSCMTIEHDPAASRVVSNSGDYMLALRPCSGMPRDLMLLAT